MIELLEEGKQKEDALNKNDPKVAAEDSVPPVECNRVVIIKSHKLLNMNVPELK